MMMFLAHIKICSNFEVFNFDFLIFWGQIFMWVCGCCKIFVWPSGRQPGEELGAAQKRKPARTRSYFRGVKSESAVRWRWFGHASQVAATFQRPSRGARPLAALALEILGLRGKRPGVLMNSWTQVISFTILVKGFPAARPRTRSKVFPDFQ